MALRGNLSECTNRALRSNPDAPRQMAGVAQSVERQIVALEVASSKLVARPKSVFRRVYALISLGCRQAVRHGILIPAFVGSNPATPAIVWPISSVGRALDF